jgi:hypothetical protein
MGAVIFQKPPRAMLQIPVSRKTRCSKDCSGALFVARSCPCRPGYGLPSFATCYGVPVSRRSGPARSSLAFRPKCRSRIHEIKHDSYRLIARKREDRVRLFTRRGYDWTERYPLIRTAVAALSAASAVVDGEAVCCDAVGVAVFKSCIAEPMTMRRSCTPSIFSNSTARTGVRGPSEGGLPRGEHH